MGFALLQEHTFARVSGYIALFRFLLLAHPKGTTQFGYG